MSRNVKEVANGEFLGGRANLVLVRYERMNPERTVEWFIEVTIGADSEAEAVRLFNELKDDYCATTRLKVHSGRPDE